MHCLVDLKNKKHCDFIIKNQGIVTHKEITTSTGKKKKVKRKIDLSGWNGQVILEFKEGHGIVSCEAEVFAEAKTLTDAELKKAGWDRYKHMFNEVDVSHVKPRKGCLKVK